MSQFIKRIHIHQLDAFPGQAKVPELTRRDDLYFRVHVHLINMDGVRSKQVLVCGNIIAIPSPCGDVQIFRCE